MIHWLIEPEFMTDAELLGEFQALQDAVDDDRKAALLAEMNRRQLALNL